MSGSDCDCGCFSDSNSDSDSDTFTATDYVTEHNMKFGSSSSDEEEGSVEPAVGVRRKRGSRKLPSSTPEDRDYDVNDPMGSEEWGGNEYSEPGLFDSDDEEDAIWGNEFLSDTRNDEEKEKDRVAVSKHVLKSVASQKAWGESRATLTCAYIAAQGTETSLCFKCGEVDAVVRCLDCAGYASVGGLFLCAACDTDAHPYAHFHRREYCINDCWQPLAPTMQYDPTLKDWTYTCTYLRSLLRKTARFYYDISRMHVVKLQALCP